MVLERKIIYVGIFYLVLSSPSLFFFFYTTSYIDGPLIVSFPYGPINLDPQDAESDVATDVIRQVCEGLFMYNYSSPELELIPNLAIDENLGSITTSPGTMVNLTLNLKEGVTFHNEVKFNASSVKWIFDRIQYW